MNDFNSLLNRMLELVPDTMDKRQGSIIYDALAPAAAELAQAYINLEIWKEQTYLLTATGSDLDRRAEEFAVTRIQATNAKRIAKMYGQNDELIDVPIGSRYAVPSDTVNVSFIAVERLDIGEFILQSEIPGTVGNEYYGNILPLQINNRLRRAEITGTHIPARDTETDDDFRQRALDRRSQIPFAGNIASYKEFVGAIDGVGDLKVFPVWNGGGSVKLSIIDNVYDIASQTLMDYVKEIVDPIEYTGTGVGIAPIGHVVTITTPEKIKLEIEATVQLSGVTIGQIKTQAEQNIKEYLLSVRKSWAESQTLNIYSLLIANAILNVNGVLNVTGVKINGEYGDLIINQTEEIQYLPYFERLELHE